MRRKLALLAVLLLGACEGATGPTASCFTLLEGDCNFAPLPPRLGGDDE